MAATLPARCLRFLPRCPPNHAAPTTGSGSARVSALRDGTVPSVRSSTSRVRPPQNEVPCVSMLRHGGGLVCVCADVTLGGLYGRVACHCVQTPQFTGPCSSRWAPGSGHAARSRWCIERLTHLSAVPPGEVSEWDHGARGLCTGCPDGPFSTGQDRCFLPSLNRNVWSAHLQASGWARPHQPVPRPLLRAELCVLART